VTSGKPNTGILPDGSRSIKSQRENSLATLRERALAAMRRNSAEARETTALISSAFACCANDNKRTLDDDDRAMLSEIDLLIAPARRLRRKPNPRPRRTQRRDSRDARKMGFTQRKAPNRATVPATSPLVAIPLPSFPLHKPTTSTSHLPNSCTPTYGSSTPTHLPVSKSRRADDSDTRRPASWRETGDLSKAHAIAGVLSDPERNNGREAKAITINFGRSVAAVADERPAEFIGWVRDRFSRELKAALGDRREFAFTIEFADGRPHCHGVLCANDNELPALIGAFQRAAGNWDAQRHHERQIDIRPVWDAHGWATYCMKGAALARRKLGVKSALCAPNSLRHDAPAFWERARDKSVVTDDKSVLT
jgi:hypothetical protein